MIGTIEIKRQQLATGTFKVGSGREIILIMGSCRSIPYLNYLNEWNKSHNRFTIHYLDPFNWNWNEKNEFVDYHEAIRNQESNKELLKVLGSVDIFLHEYYKSFGMFNTMDDGEKNIYDFGINPKIDVCIPNFNDLFILFSDIVSFDSSINEKAKADYNSIGTLSEETENEIYIISQRNLDKFYSICRLSGLPEMEEVFRNNFTKKRFFWTSNHIAKDFSLVAFKLLNDKFLKLELSDGFWKEISKEDMYANNYTYLTEYDIKHYGYEFNEEMKYLKDLFN